MEKTGGNVLTTTDVAALCAVDATTVLNWIKAGKLKSYHTPGGHHRILKEDLWLFVKEHGLPLLETTPRSDATKKRVLIVDDDPDFLSLLKEGLARESDWLLDTADSSLEAGLKVGSWHPDLIIMDLKMPGFDGVDFCRFLKKTFNTAKLPVIVVSGVSKQDPTTKDVLALGIIDYFEKPFATPLLIQEIRSFFRVSALPTQP